MSERDVSIKKKKKNHLQWSRYIQCGSSASHGPGGFRPSSGQPATSSCSIGDLVDSDEQLPQQHLDVQLGATDEPAGSPLQPWMPSSSFHVRNFQSGVSQLQVLQYHQ